MMHRFALVSAIALLAACSSGSAPSTQSNEFTPSDRGASPNDPAEPDPEGEGAADAGADTGSGGGDTGVGDADGGGSSTCAAASSGWRAMADMPTLEVDLKGRRIDGAAWTGTRLDMLREWPTDCVPMNPCVWHAQALSFDPVANSWEVLPTPPGDAMFMRSVDHTDGQWILFADFDQHGYVFDASTKAWTAIPAAPLVSRNNVSAVYATTTKELIVYGGLNETESGPTSYNDGAAFSLVTRTWRTIAAAPLPGGAHGMASWDGKRMNIVYPTQYEDGEAPIVAAGAYDPATDTWSSVPLPPVTPRVIDAYTDVAKNPAFFGGYRFTGDAIIPAERDGAWLDTATNTWSVMPDPGPTIMTGISWDNMTMFAASGRYYVWGGYEYTEFPDEDYVRHRVNTGFFYDPATKTWSAMPTSGAPSPRVYAQSVWTGCDAIVFGGLGDVDTEWNGALFRP